MNVRLGLASMLMMNFPSSLEGLKFWEQPSSGSLNSWRNQTCDCNSLDAWSSYSKVIWARVHTVRGREERHEQREAMGGEQKRRHHSTTKGQAGKMQGMSDELVLGAMVCRPMPCHLVIKIFIPGRFRECKTGRFVMEL